MWYKLVQYTKLLTTVTRNDMHKKKSVTSLKSRALDIKAASIYHPAYE